MAPWDHFCPCEAPAPTGAVAVSSLPGQPATAAGMLPWALGFAILYTTCVVACMPSLSLGRLFLAALRHSQNQYKRCESGERLHVSAWYRFSPMGATRCASLDDPSGSLHAHFWLRVTTFGHARAPPRRCGCRIFGLPCRPATGTGVMPWA